MVVYGYHIQTMCFFSFCFFHREIRDFNLLYVFFVSKLNGIEINNRKKQNDSHVQIFIFK